ncbi:MAG: preprotein translocase subunit SecD [bacterium ADurb.Bin212]|nr:MAG: preprotein translocase subunit SecD [bacterium ADurb.Bin212]
MNKNLYYISAIIVVLLTLSILLVIPKSPLAGEKIKARLGLDLQGGTELTYQADLSASSNKINDMDNLKNVFRNRIDTLGVAEPTIQNIGSDKILIELPGVRDINKAIETIGQTYELVFMVESTAEDGGVQLQDYYEDYTLPNYWKPSDLTGRNLVPSKTDVTFNNSQNSISSEPVVSITFDNAGKDKFANLTKENVGKQIAITLDNKIVTAPRVESSINDGKAVITGSKDVEEAQKLAKRLKEGALPIQAKLIGQRNIGASLGSDSLKYSIVAAIIGFISLAIFMISYYKFPGLLATLALIIYTIISIAIFKLIPVTLSLAGIAGFILSVGMALDANVLIFERTREELRFGKSSSLAIKDGFLRAWPSIRDSNLSSIITCIILYYFGSGPVRGFALTLAIGIAVSMFTAITVTRTFIMLLSNVKKGKLVHV